MVQEDDSRDTEHGSYFPHATVSDMVHLQRATASCMVPLRSLGRGAFAEVELVSMPVAGQRKLLVCKKLASQDTAQQPQPGTCQGQTHHEEQLKHHQQQKQQQQQQQELQKLQVPPPLKPSSLQDWSREVTMHRETAGCPFVLQLLAAKKCRAGNMLLLTEYAAAGSMTDVLARMRLQQQRARRTQQEHAFRRCQSASALLQHQQPQPGDDVQLQEESSVLFAANSDSVAALCDALKDTSTPTAMLIHGVDLDITAAAELQAAAATAAAAGGGGGRELPVLPVSAGLCETSARFYTACILMGLQWLHSRRILHRDIKPCNLLLFSDGYLKLADLGCCCLLPPGIDSARTRTGTSQYMAPEVVDGKNSSGYSFPVDMWSLGVTLWQMVAGSLPDWAEQQTHHHAQHAGEQQEAGQQQGLGQHTDESIMLPLEPATATHTTPRDLEFPPQFSKELCDLLTGLLETDSSARLSIPEVQATSWFDGFDWKALQDKTLPPPVLPAHVVAIVQQM